MKPIVSDNIALELVYKMIRSFKEMEYSKWAVKKQGVEQRKASPCCNTSHTNSKLTRTVGCRSFITKRRVSAPEAYTRPLLIF